MRQNLLIFSPRMAHPEEIYAALNKYNISASIVFDAQEAVAILITDSPDFFWLDVDIEAAQMFLIEISSRTLRPPPYIILTSSFGLNIFHGESHILSGFPGAVTRKLQIDLG